MTYGATEVRRFLGCVLLAASLALSACAPLGVAAGGTAVGVTAAQERGLGTATKDARIQADIGERWFREDFKLFNAIDLEVHEGRVLMTGSVPDPDTRLTAVRIAWQVEGVKEVINEVVVDDESRLQDKARDGWITTQLKTKLLLDDAIASINYSVETVNQTVYLMGIAQDQAELDQAMEHARNVKYVRRVISHMRLKDDPARSPS